VTELQDQVKTKIKEGIQIKFTSMAERGIWEYGKFAHVREERTGRTLREERTE
jgi:hypothetical protein